MGENNDSSDLNRKRLRPNEPSPSDPSPVDLPPPSVPPRFLILHSDTKPLARVSPFLIAKGLQGLAGSLKSVKKLPSGDLLVETASSAQTQCLLKSNMLADIPISVTPHNTLNSSRGVVSTDDLRDIDDATLAAELASQGVTSARRITLRRGTETVPTRHIILTFSSPTLPTSIKAGYVHCSVRHYIPNPLRCFKCQRFGHSKTSCRSSEVCAKCSARDHVTDACTATSPICANCQGEHPAYSRACPKWKEEKTVQEIKTTENISYGEARRRLPSTISFPHSYAAAVRSSTSQSTQTDLSVPPSYSFADALRKCVPSADPTPLQPSTSTASTNTAVSLISNSPIPPKSKQTSATTKSPHLATASKPAKYTAQQFLKGSRKAGRKPISSQSIPASNRFAALADEEALDDGIVFMEDAPLAPPPEFDGSSNKPKRQPITPPK